MVIRAAITLKREGALEAQAVQRLAWAVMAARVARRRHLETKEQRLAAPVAQVAMVQLVDLEDQVAAPRHPASTACLLAAKAGLEVMVP